MDALLRCFLAGREHSSMRRRGILEIGLGGGILRSDRPGSSLTGREPNWVGSRATAEQVPEAGNSLAPCDSRAATAKWCTFRSAERLSVCNLQRVRYCAAPRFHVGAHCPAGLGGFTPNRLLHRPVADLFRRPGRHHLRGAEYISDPVAFAAAALSDLVITFHVDQAPEVETGHPESRSTSYLVHLDWQGIVIQPPVRPDRPRPVAARPRVSRLSRIIRHDGGRGRAAC